jgi:hypothetical protein
MKSELIVLSLIVVTIIVTITMTLYAWADTDKNYCYDQVGDGHGCFETKQKCKGEQKKDEIAESPCYNQINE